MLRPQKRKMERVAPMVDMRITVVTWRRSHRMPMTIVETTPDALRSARSRVPIAGERPREEAKVGR